MNLQDKKTLATYGLITTGGAAGTFATTSPVLAQAAPASVTNAVGSIESTMSSLGGLAAAALVVALGVTGVYYGMKYGKKIMGQG